MIGYHRPPAPKAFTRAAAKRHQAAAAQAKRGTKPDVDDDIWGDHRHVLAVAQHGKCAYCERKVASHYPPVEHVAPRNEVHALPDDPADWGSEAHPHLSNIAEGHLRKADPLSDWGYWSRAYDWNNYVVACQSCNTWKSTIYPLEKRPAAGWRPGATRTRSKDELLLHAFEDDAPWRHFQYDASTGAISWRTARGKATTGTCGLHRASLAHERQLHLDHVHALCRRAQGNASPLRDAAWDDLIALGADDKPFAGMVRSYAETTLGKSWPTIVREARRSTTAAPTKRRGATPR